MSIMTLTIHGNLWFTILPGGMYLQQISLRNVKRQHTGRTKRRICTKDRKYRKSDERMVKHTVDEWTKAK